MQVSGMLSNAMHVEGTHSDSNETRPGLSEERSRECRTGVTPAALKIESWVVYLSVGLAPSVRPAAESLAGAKPIRARNYGHVDGGLPRHPARADMFGNGFLTLAGSAFVAASSSGFQRCCVRSAFECLHDCQMASRVRASSHVRMLARWRRNGALAVSGPPGFLMF